MFPALKELLFEKLNYLLAALQKYIAFYLNYSVLKSTVTTPFIGALLVPMKIP
jgi:hypothetical protein